ncbi:ATP-dependent RNA helicase DED1 [Carpediemonas membranifera]|uniref:RNA helicase n=1 Tax=Carpediemonas membranifera TaxID=201153 RepID=A0A8J6E289_9EUKA|nr:ATP-dependent RNA helicase DED1 [Carpediemonas membranifera]|eukprot:KAG9394388.1 ATP-dependent RNA helicase DED1 [Carpediemonas membranifera]
MWNQLNDEEEERRLFGDQTAAGINFDEAYDIPIEISGIDEVPEGIETFKTIKLTEPLNRNIGLANYEKPTPIQKVSIPITLAGHDLMASAQTGSAFLVPVIEKMLASGRPQHYVEQTTGYNSRRQKATPVTLILSPTRELSSQIAKEAKKFTFKSGIKTVCVYGGASVQDQQRELDWGCDILVATPGRLIDFVTRGRITLANIGTLILDEADKMLEMGFEMQIREIVEELGMPQPEDGRQTLMFSATFPDAIQRLARSFLRDYAFISIGKVGSTTNNIEQRVMHIQENDKFRSLVSILSAHPEDLTLVFVETKINADRLEDLLIREGFRATSIHGDRAQWEREEALSEFRNHHATVLVATDVAQRGLDIPSVAHVINFDMPKDIQDYVHRIGRTGRVGHKGVATSFVNENCRGIVGPMLDLLRDSKQQVPSWLPELARNFSYRGGRGGRGGGNRSRDTRSGISSHRFTHGSRGGAAGGFEGMRRGGVSGFT